MKITIDDIKTEVSPGTTVMEAAMSLGIEIPSMCFMPGHSNHPSCMVCIVEDEKNGRMFPSCAMPVSDEMRISTKSDAVVRMRREAIELLLSDHLGDCEAPCRLSCPAFMNIPLMNRLIAKGDFKSALSITRTDIAIPLVLGYICSAPCEKACHRHMIDGAVSVCLLKRFVSDITDDYENVICEPSKGKKIAVIGTGPAGLSAAFYLLRKGYNCVCFDKDDIPGGGMKSVSEQKLPLKILEKEIRVITKMGAVFKSSELITSEMIPDLKADFDAVIFATGKDFPDLTIDHPGFFFCGNSGRTEKMAVRSAAKGKEAALRTVAFLEKKSFHSEKNKFSSKAGKLTTADQEEYLKESVKSGRTEPENGWLNGFSKAEAMKEAARCMHCDCRKPEECKLRKLAVEYKADRNHFHSPERKKIVKILQHDLVIYEPQKCIRCGLCVEISSKDTGMGMAFFGRGYDVEIAPSLHIKMSEALINTANDCIKACPTGALSSTNK